MYVCIHEVIQVIIMKIKMKNRSYRYDKSKPKYRHGHKKSKYKKSFTMMLLCIKQHQTTFVAQFMK